MTKRFTYTQQIDILILQGFCMLANLNVHKYVFCRCYFRMLSHPNVNKNALRIESSVVIGNIFGRSLL